MVYRLTKILGGKLVDDKTLSFPQEIMECLKKFEGEIEEKIEKQTQEQIKEGMKSDDFLEKITEEIQSTSKGICYVKEYYRRLTEGYVLVPSEGQLVP